MASTYSGIFADELFFMVTAFSSLASGWCIRGPNSMRATGTVRVVRSRHGLAFEGEVSEKGLMEGQGVPGPMKAPAMKVPLVKNGKFNGPGPPMSR